MLCFWNWLKHSLWFSFLVSNEVCSVILAKWENLTRKLFPNVVKFLRILNGILKEIWHANYMLIDFFSPFPFYLCAKLLQSCWTPCEPMDYSPPGSSVRGTLQARILEWVAIPSSRGSSWPRDRTCIFCVFCTGRGISLPLTPPELVILFLCFPGGPTIKASVCMLFTYIYSIFACKIPWTEEPGGLQSTGSQRVRYNWAHIHTCT